MDSRLKATRGDCRCRRNRSIGVPFARPSLRLLHLVHLLCLYQFFAAWLTVQLLQDRQHLLLRIDRGLRLALQYHCVTLFFHPLQQRPHPSVAHAHLLRRFHLADTALRGAFQPLGSSRFVPSFSLAAVNRNFLLGSFRTLSFGGDILQHGMSPPSRNVLFLDGGEA